MKINTESRIVDVGFLISVSLAIVIAIVGMVHQYQEGIIRDGQEQIATPVSEETDAEIQRRIEDRRRSDSAPDPSAPDSLQR